MDNNIEYCYWMIWGRTYEGDKRWHMGRFIDGTEAEDVCEIVKSTLNGGVGGDTADVLEVEYGYDDGIWTDYTEYKNSNNKL